MVSQLFLVRPISLVTVTNYTTQKECRFLFHSELVIVYLNLKHKLSLGEREVFIGGSACFASFSEACSNVQRVKALFICFIFSVFCFEFNCFFAILCLLSRRLNGSVIM